MEINQEVPVKSMSNVVSLKYDIEAHELTYDKIHKINFMAQISTNEILGLESKIPMDFVITIDNSSSMRLEQKLKFVKATIEFIVSKLNENHRLCLVIFNHDVEILTEGLLEMNSENKKKVLLLLNSIQSSGSTNISEALITSLSILENRESLESDRLSSVMLLTDGLANVGLRGNQFLNKLKNIIIPKNTVINTFGFGSDHDSSLLSKICMSSIGGMYYYIDKVENIGSIFGICLGGLLSTIIKNVKLQFLAPNKNGCRIINLDTIYPIVEKESLKYYEIFLGSMFNNETKTIIIKLSIDKRNEALKDHFLFDLILTYQNCLTGEEVVVNEKIKIERPNKEKDIYTKSDELELQLYRYKTASVLSESCSLINEHKYTDASNLLKKHLSEITLNSNQSNQQVINLYQDITNNLIKIISMLNPENIYLGIHYVITLMTQYYMERASVYDLKMMLNNNEQESINNKKYSTGYLNDSQQSMALEASNIQYINILKYVDM